MSGKNIALAFIVLTSKVYLIECTIRWIAKMFKKASVNERRKRLARVDLFKVDVFYLQSNHTTFFYFFHFFVAFN